MADTLSPARPNAGTPAEASTTPAPPHRWSLRSLALIVLAWFTLQIGGLFSPGLLDDVDSIYTEIACEMLHRHDFVTPYINGIRFFDKPPLMYWMAASSMAAFGESDWAARLPLAVATLALFISVYALGTRLYGERGGFYGALATATGIGPYLYTRFFIPDILICLWMTLGVHLFLIALERVRMRVPQVSYLRPGFTSTPLIPCLGFAAVLALNLLTKGLIGLVFLIAFVLLYLLLTRQLTLLKHLHPLASAATFLAIAAPWHVLAALRNPAIPLPSGLGLPATGGWAWFYLYNEHFARFLGRRIPHDYGNTPVWLFWLYAALWLMPWTAFLPGALAEAYRNLRLPFTNRQREAALAPTLWTAVVLIFFSLCSRQEYYSLPAIPALALLAGGLLTRADEPGTEVGRRARASALRGHLWLLIPIATIVAAITGYFALTAPRPAPGTDIATLLAGNPDLYNLSLGHVFDLTGAAMGLFRAPLAGVALSMLAIGPLSFLLRRAGRQYAANLTLAAAMLLTLACAHEGLRRFYPILGSKSLALALDHAIEQPTASNQQPPLVLLDGEFTSGSTLVFYTHQQVHLLNGRVNTLWYGSFWPDAPHVFETEATLRTLWASPRRVFLFTYNAADRTRDLAPLAPVHTLATAGGKTVLTNR